MYISPVFSCRVTYAMRRVRTYMHCMMNDLKWPTLYEHRKYCRLNTFYKFLHQNPPDINIPHYLPHSLSHFTHLLHHYRLIPPIISTNYYQKSFFPHTIADGNSLPNELIECATLDKFSYFVIIYDNNSWTKHLNS